MYSQNASNLESLMMEFLKYVRLDLMISKRTSSMVQLSKLTWLKVR